MEVLTITPAELKQEMANNKPLLLLDVREPVELAGKLAPPKGALNIPLPTLAGKLADLAEYKNRDVVVICRSGHRAGTAGQILKKAGFGRVKVLEGGMLNWVKNR